MSKFLCKNCTDNEHGHLDHTKSISCDGESLTGLPCMDHRIECSNTWLDSTCECDVSKSAFYASKESLRHAREDDFIRAQKLEGLLKRLYPICESLLLESLLLRGGAPWNKELENILDEIDHATLA